MGRRRRWCWFSGTDRHLCTDRRDPPFDSAPESRLMAKKKNAASTPARPAGHLFAYCNAECERRGCSVWTPPPTPDTTTTKRRHRRGNRYRSYNTVQRSQSPGSSPLARSSTGLIRPLGVRPRGVHLDRLVVNFFHWKFNLYLIRLFADFLTFGKVD
ncbi:unnamed protein product [Heligmosomoides polygyrus]|uniref:Uncharacterized protein n=1 Tax=Heligmosomoides polygyrus TaxID=6339 RepID=A0A183FSG2_HELPZ|nr:unnamed protein product [Heligmosomoides polygyrus]